MVINVQKLRQKFFCVLFPLKTQFPIELPCVAQIFHMHSLIGGFLTTRKSDRNQMQFLGILMSLISRIVMNPREGGLLFFGQFFFFFTKSLLMQLCVQRRFEIYHFLITLIH